MLTDSKKYLYGLFVFLLFLLGTQYYNDVKATEEAPLEVNFLDVGQGDAILISYLGEYQMLIDGGPDSTRLIGELKEQMPPDDKKIEIVAASHYDQDHVGGLAGLLDDYEVELFIDNGREPETKIAKSLLEKMEKMEIERQSVLEGSKIEMGEHLEFSVFNPDEVGSSRNEGSVVLRMDFGENSFLFTGDVGLKAEADMISDEEDVDVDWLKVAHHGSKNSSGEGFLKKVSAESAIISVGDNSYGHPAQEALERLKSSGVENIYTTQERGTIEVECYSLKKPCQIKSF